jgi:hypothetical protein
MTVRQIVLTDANYARIVNKSQKLMDDIEAGLRRRSIANKSLVQKIKPSCRVCGKTLKKGERVISRNSTAGGRSIQLTKYYHPDCARMKNII